MHIKYVKNIIVALYDRKIQLRYWILLMGDNNAQTSCAYCR
jgi:hypothetical protein